MAQSQSLFTCTNELFALSPSGELVECAPSTPRSSYPVIADQTPLYRALTNQTLRPLSPHHGSSNCEDRPRNRSSIWSGPRSSERIEGPTTWISLFHEAKRQASAKGVSKPAARNVKISFLHPACALWSAPLPGFRPFSAIMKDICGVADTVSRRCSSSSISVMEKPAFCREISSRCGEE